MDQCLIGIYSCLSFLRLRNWVLRQTAFMPHATPTYTFRSEFYDSRVQQQTESLDETKLANSDASNLTIQGEQLTFDQQDTHSLRFHRISSAITEKDARPYRVGNSQPSQVVSSQNKTSLSNIPNNSSRKQKSIELCRPYDSAKYPELNIKLIDKQLIANSVALPEDLDAKGYYLDNEYGNTFAVAVVQLKTQESEYCIIHSHGNSPDIGIMLDSYFDLCYNLEACIVGYDYPGYGQSESSPNDMEILDTIEAVYKFVTKQLKFEWKKVILYGQSIGSGPSTFLAAQRRCPVAGLIIHSGFMSGLRVITPSMKYTAYYDFFPNIDYMENVNCKVFIIHGTNDLQIDQSQAQQLARKAKNLFREVYIQNAGHNNIEYEDAFRREYFYSLRDFMAEIIKMNETMSTKDIEKEFRARTLSTFNHIYSNLKDRSNTQSSKRTSSARNQADTMQSKSSEMEMTGSRHDELDISGISRKTQAAEPTRAISMYNSGTRKKTEKPNKQSNNIHRSTVVS